MFWIFHRRLCQHEIQHFQKQLAYINEQQFRRRHWWWLSDKLKTESALLSSRCAHRTINHVLVQKKMHAHPIDVRINIIKQMEHGTVEQLHWFFHFCSSNMNKHNQIESNMGQRHEIRHITPHTQRSYALPSFCNDWLWQIWPKLQHTAIMLLVIQPFFISVDISVDCVTGPPPTTSLAYTHSKQKNNNKNSNSLMQQCSRSDRTLPCRNELCRMHIIMCAMCVYPACACDMEK